MEQVLHLSCHPKVFHHMALEAGCGIASELFGLEAGTSPLTAQAAELLLRENPEIPAKTIRQIHRQLMRADEFTLYTLRRIATPGDPDFRWRPLSAKWNGLYWILRPARVIREKLTPAGRAA